MTELRKQWLQEHNEKQAAFQAKQEAIKVLGAKKAAKHKAAREEVKLQTVAAREIADAEFELHVAQDMLARAKRQVLREQLLEEQRQLRREVLLEQSRSWITREDLASRIQQALDNPLPMVRLPEAALGPEDDNLDG